MAPRFTCSPWTPVAKGAEYSVGNILVEGFGAEGQTLYKTYSDAYANPGDRRAAAFNQGVRARQVTRPTAGHVSHRRRARRGHVDVDGFGVRSAACANAGAAGATGDPPRPPARVFGSDTGLVLNFIKPDKTADFEAIVAKVKEALQKSANPQRQQQAASWRVYKSPDAAAGGAALYVFIVDPVVKGADYTVSTILAEGFPDEVAALYKTYSESYSSRSEFRQPGAGHGSREVGSRCDQHSELQIQSCVDAVRR